MSEHIVVSRDGREVVAVVQSAIVNYRGDVVGFRGCVRYDTRTGIAEETGEFGLKEVLWVGKDEKDTDFVDFSSIFNVEEDVNG
jgi:hypothetical protein